MPFRFRFCLIIGYLVSILNSQAQISVTPSVGCSPGLTNANFAYLGPTASSLTWNFGDGSPTTNVTAPQHSYLGVGSYTVVCNAIVSGSPQTFTFVVTVYPLPSGSMNPPSLPPSGCAPRTVSFSATGTNTNINYTWSFGDNTVGSGQSLTHAYVAQGSFYPVLTLLDNITGCSKAVNWTTPIQVSSLPNLVISSFPGTFSCSAPFTTAFSASNCTSGSPISGGGLSFNWGFGNGQTANVVTPGNITYNTSAVYIVTLSAVDNNNCSNTTTLQVSLVTPTLQVTVPQAVCINTQFPAVPHAPYFYVTIVTSQTTSYWNMGDGTPVIQFPWPSNAFNSPPTTTVITPNVPYTSYIHTYTTPGLKTITITVNSGTCTATQTKTIFVENITPAFATAPHIFTCSPTVVANYTNFSVTNYTAPLSYTWWAQNWNPTTTYTIATTNPTFTFTQGSTNPYTIYKTYKPMITLLVESPLGCHTSSVHIYDSIMRPTAVFTKTKKEGCAPLAVIFMDSSYTNPNVFPITSYTWNNGASPPVIQSGTLAPAPAANSLIPNFTYTYTNPGTYYPFLQIQTLGGCSSTSFIDTVKVVNPPNIAMTLTPNLSVCAGQSVQINLSTNSNPPPQHVHVESGSNYFSGCVSDPNPVWSYHNPGVYGFTVSAYLNSCSVSVVPVQTIQVKGPAVAARYTTNCNNKLVVDFNYAIRDVQTLSLNVGVSPASYISFPGSPGNTLTGSYTYTYPSTGNYTAFITGVNSSNGCGPYTQTMLVTVRQPSAEFSYQPIVCRGAAVNFTAQTFTDNLQSCLNTYVWFINGVPDINTYSYSTTSFSATGIQTVTLRVKDINGCEDTTRHTFRVTNPAPDFSFNNNPICFSQYPIQLNNITPQLPDAVNSFTWMYGPPLNSAPFPVTTQTVTGTGAQTHTFYMGGSPTQTFDIKLIAKDVVGCIDSIRHKIQVNNPQAFFYAPSATCTPGGAVTFYFLSQTTYTNYNVNFNNGVPPINTPNNSATANFTQVGIYTPTLTVTDNQGCTSSYSKSLEVQAYPVADFTLQTSTGLFGTSFCKQQGSSVTVSLTSTSATSSPSYYIWDLGIPPVLPAGSNTTAGTSYTAAGTYTLKLSVMTSAPCISTKSIVINIYDEPSATAVVDKTVFCKGDPIQVTINNSYAVDHWQWDFGDNQATQVLSQASQTTISYNYQPNFFPTSTNGNLLILLTYASPFNVCKNLDTLRVKMIRVEADFMRNNELSFSDYAHCLGTADSFSNTTITNASLLTYTWSFGDGNSSNQTSPQHSYLQAGNYLVSLTAMDPNVGCIHTVSKTMTVFPLPTASLNIQDMACPDSLFNVIGTGFTQTNGTLSGTLISSQSNYSLSFHPPANTFSLQVSASATQVYTLLVSDNNGCRNIPVTDTIHILTPPPSVNTTTTIVIGQTVTLNANVGNNYNYSWVPLTANLSCTNCSNPVSSTTANITYTVAIVDLPMKCFVVENKYTVLVQLLASLDVPSAFTPNNDGINDVIGPGGWGIRKVNYFKVFNRWGQLLFESNDLDSGWDGTFNGIPQNVETYIYQASVDTYTDETLTKSGSFKLIR